jgi:all-trans-retinol 13,14-reductase
VSNTSALQEAAKQGRPTDEVPVTEIRAKNIVFASSIYNLYGKLLPKDLATVQDFSNPAKRSVRQSHGHIFLFCKIQGDATELKLPTHNLWYFNGYDMDEAFDGYFANPREVRPPTVYIGFPCTKDKTWKRRFPGVSNCILISDGLWEWFEQWKDKPVHDRGADYEKFKDALSKHLLDILYETVPEVKGNVEFSILGTPLTEVTYLGSFCGGSYNTTHYYTRSLSGRFRCLSPRGLRSHVWRLLRRVCGSWIPWYDQTDFGLDGTFCDLHQE